VDSAIQNVRKLRTEGENRRPVYIVERMRQFNDRTIKRSRSHDGTNHVVNVIHALERKTTDSYAIPVNIQRIIARLAITIYYIEQCLLRKKTESQEAKPDIR
jgi:hypothetical protein